MDVWGSEDRLLFEVPDQLVGHESYPNSYSTATAFGPGSRMLSFVVVRTSRRGPWKCRPPRVSTVGHDAELHHSIGRGFLSRLFYWGDRREFVFLVDPPKRKGAAS